MPASSPLSRNAQIQMAVDLDALDRTDESKKLLDKVIAEHPKDTEAIIELGNVQRGHKDFADCAKTYSKAIDSAAKSGEVELGNVLLPRHLLRALASVAARRSRYEEGAAALSRSAAGAQLSRLFVGRPGRPSRSRHGHDPQGRRAAAGRRLHRRFAGLGLFPHRQLRRGGQESGTRRRAQAGRSDHQRPSRRCLLAGRAHAWKRTSNGRRRSTSSPIRKICPRSRPSCKNGLPSDTSSAADASKPTAPTDADKANSAADADKAKKTGNGG